MEASVSGIKAKETFQAKEVVPEERWASLVEDLKDIMTEHILKSREAIIEMKWYLGDRLLEEGEEAIRPCLQRVAVELKISERDLYYCVAFRKKFPRMEELWEKAPEGKNISWHKLINNYIDFTTPKPEVPIEEKMDTFGLLEWWTQQKDLHAVRLTHKGYELNLIIRPEKSKSILPEKHAHLRDVYAELGKHFITLKHWDAEDLNRNDYARMNKALKELLEKAKYDKEKVKKAMDWCHDQYRGSKIDWTLETVIKKYAETQREVKPYEKYLKKR